MDKLYQNKQAFLNEKPCKLFWIVIFALIILLIILLISWNIKVYNHYLTRGFIECSDVCKINVIVPTNINFQKIKLNNKYIEPKILSKVIEIDEENVISYYMYTFLNEYNFQDKEIVEINFCYNKQRLLKKIVNSIF